MKKVILAVLTIVTFLAVACHSSVKIGDTKYRKSDATTGQTIYEGKCTKCHKAKVVDNYTPEKWSAILDKMVPKAKLDDTEKQQVTAYVMIHSKRG